MKFISYIILLFLFVLSACNKAPLSNQDQMNQKVDSLMSLMTLDEKIGQLNLVGIGFDVTGPIVSENVEEKIKQGQVGAVFNTFTPHAVRKLQKKAIKESRLGIPLLFGYDVIHGHKTIFPMPIALASTWDMDAIEQTARISAIEASADGLNWVFSPMVDICRDPRWGRIAESAGEDAWLGSQIAKAMVRGYQGSDLSDTSTVMACVKHFAMYGAAEAGRDYNTTDMSLQRMHQEYLPPYKAAIDEGVASVMTSFNEINGIPATGNPWLLKDLLRAQWNFNGMVVTDYTSINEMVPHGFVANDAEAAVSAINAGVDMDMVGEAFLNHLKDAVNSRLVSVETINLACRNILEAKYKLGLFDDPYKYANDQRAFAHILSEQFIKASRDIACKSIVLLKNDKQTLPLNADKSIALIGPLAKNKRDLIGNWSAAGDWKQAISVEEGLRTALGNKAKINYAKGANIATNEQMLRRLNQHGGNIEIDDRPSHQMISEAVKVAKQSNLIVAVVGESQGMSGEAASRSSITLPGKQQDLLKALKATGKPLIIVLMNGRPLDLQWENEYADAIIETWYGGTQAGNAIADVLTGKYNPSAKLTVTFPKNIGQIPIFYNHKNTGRPYSGVWQDKYKSRYMDVDNEPLYPFGYGLSYTSYQYSPIRLSDTIVSPNQTINAYITIRNTGAFDGEEVVQLYIRDKVASITRPVKELKNFKKVFLKSGESKEIDFEINVDDLSFYNNDLLYDYEEGQFELFIGTNSRDNKTAAFSAIK